MEAITYSLQHEQNNSQYYYNTVQKFTDKVLAYSGDSLKPIVIEFKEYLQTYNLEDVRESEEFILELISFGILSKTYTKTALSVQ